MLRGGSEILYYDKVMVTSTGKGLNVLIRSECSFVSNWVSFGCWYSVQKKLPDANIAIVCEGQADVSIGNLFVWPGRVGAKIFRCVDFDKFFVELFDRENCNLFDLPLLVLDDRIVVVDEFSSSILNCFNEKDSFLADDFVMLFKDKNAKNDFLNGHCKDFNFSVDIKSDSSSCFVSFGEDFVSSEWIHSNKAVLYEGIQNIGNLNEAKVLDIWNQAREIFPLV